MKKILSTIALLACSVTIMAQTTAEELIALMPALPTEAEMIRFQKEKSAPLHMNVELTQPDLYNDFFEALKAAKEKVDEQLSETGDAMLSKIMGSQAAGTGHTVSEISEMSESQLEQLAKNKVASTLGGMGLSMSDLAKLGDGEISDAQAMALAKKVMASKMGGGNNMAQQQKVAQLNQELLACGSREQALNQEIMGMIPAVKAKGRELFDREFKTRVQACEATMEQAIKEGAFSEKYTAAEAPAVEAAGKKYNAAAEQCWRINCEFYAKFIPMWRNTILEAMNKCKTKMLPLQNEKKRLTDELYAITQDASHAVGATYPPIAVGLYLEQPGIIDQYDTVLDESEE